MADNENPNVVVQFDQTPESRFYMCRSCRNHLFSLENQSERKPDVIICQNAVNLKPEHVYAICKDCDSKVGWQFSTVMFGGGANPDVEEEKWFHLALNKMVFWNGDKVVYADTEQPVEDNGHPNLVVTFHQTPESRFYKCRSCRNPLLSFDDQFYRDQLSNIIYCRNVVNVKAEGVEYVWNCNELAILKVSCDRCNSVLGLKIHNATVPLSASSIIQYGSFMLKLKKMLLWDGTQVVYADTLEAAGDN